MKIKSVMFGAATPVVVLLTAISLNGCAGVTPRPDDALVRAKTAVDQATTAGSGQYAPVDLNSAGSKLQSANEAEAKGDYKQAKYLAEESQVDAELALAKTQDAKAQEAASQVRKGNQALQNQVDQPNNPPLN
jgi:Domain of unknown function (DUF4398)